LNRKLTGVNEPERVFRKKKKKKKKERKKERKSRNLVAVCIYIYMTTGDKRATFSLTASISSIV
jgi:hypothetical protein